MGLKKTPRFVLLTIGLRRAASTASYLAALLLRFEGDVPAALLARLPRGRRRSSRCSRSLGFFVAGLYHGLWRYASTVTLFQIAQGRHALGHRRWSCITLFIPDVAVPAQPDRHGVAVASWCCSAALRFAWRLSRERVLGPAPRSARCARWWSAPTTRGVHLIQEMRRVRRAPSALTPIGFIDDDAAPHRAPGRGRPGAAARSPTCRACSQEQRVEMVVVSDPDDAGQGGARDRALLRRGATCGSRRCPGSRTCSTGRTGAVADARHADRGPARAASRCSSTSSEVARRSCAASACW